MEVDSAVVIKKETASRKRKAELASVKREKKAAGAPAAGDDGSKKKRRKKKDPNAPKRPLNSYMLFANDYRKGLKADIKNVPGLGKELKKEWDGMSAEQKKPYQVKASANRDIYKQEMAKYKAPKKPMNSFFLFSRDHRAEVVLKHPELANNKSEVAKILGSMWDKVSKQERERYDAEYEKEKKAYDAKKKNWEQERGITEEDKKEAAKKRKAASALAKAGPTSKKQKTAASSAKAIAAEEVKKKETVLKKKGLAMKLPASASAKDIELIMSLDGGSLGAALHAALSSAKQGFGQAQDAELADMLRQKQFGKFKLVGFPDNVKSASSWLAVPKNAYQALMFARRIDRHNGNHSIEDKLGLSLWQYIPVVFPDTKPMTDVVKALTAAYGASYTKRASARSREKGVDADLKVEAGLNTKRDDKGRLPLQSGDRFEIYVGPEAEVKKLVGRGSYGNKPVRFHDLIKAREAKLVKLAGFL